MPDDRIPEAEYPISLDSIRAGLALGEFFLEYLPTVSLADGRCVGAEALIRWRRPTGVVLPEEFIAIVECTPLSGVLTYWVIETVASEMASWLRANPHAHISINVPPEILGRGGVEYVVSKSGLMDLTAQIIMEITERGIPDTLGVAAINACIDHGVRVALDDVTLSGPANLAVLARCHFHIIKLDKSLIWEISPQCPHPNWLEDIGALLRSSRITVVAEGIETEQQRSALTRANIQFGQGYYFSRPISAAAFIAFHQNAASPDGEKGAGSD